jgi:hypothetical protein
MDADSALPPGAAPLCFAKPDDADLLVEALAHVIAARAIRAMGEPVIPDADATNREAA